MGRREWLHLGLCFRTQTQGETCFSGRLVLPSFLLEIPFSPLHTPRSSYSIAPQGFSIPSPWLLSFAVFLLCVCVCVSRPFSCCCAFGSSLCSFPGMVVALHQGIFVLVICSLSPGYAAEMGGWGVGLVPSARRGRQRNGCGEGIQLL